jgi:hypothetical protein
MLREQLPAKWNTPSSSQLDAAHKFSAMILKDMLLFIIVCGVDGVCILLGSILLDEIGSVSFFNNR